MGPTTPGVGAGEPAFRHTMDREQLEAVVGTINEASEAIRNIHIHATYIQSYARAATATASGLEDKTSFFLAGLLKLNAIVDAQSAQVIGQLSEFVREAARRLERATQRLETLEIQPFLDEVKGNIILVTVPLIVLILEVFVFAGYLGMILASQETVPIRIRGHLVVGSGLAAACFLLAIIW